MREWAIPFSLILLCLLCFLSDQGRKVQVNAEEGAVDPPEDEEKIGAVPNGLQTDSDVVKRLDEVLKQTAQLIYQTALMESGFNLPDPKDFASRIYSSVKSSLNISADATIEDDDDDVEETESETKERTGTPKSEAEPAKDDADTESSDLKDELWII